MLFSPQVKESVIISNKHSKYELPHEFPNEFLKNLNQKLSGKSQNFTELHPSIQSPSQN